MGKTHKTAVVLVPPEELWEPIQSIRRKYDRQFRRWMPHITLLYPFKPREEFERVAELFERCSEKIEPFCIELARFAYFKHFSGRCTLWLAPEPHEPVDLLQELLWREVPECDDTRRYEGGFVAHLSVGEVRSVKEADTILAELQKEWKGLRFEVRGVFLIAREDPPDDAFRVERFVPFNAGRC